MNINFTLSKSDRIAGLSFFSSCVKFLVGPATLLFISMFLSDEELGFYYVFFSIIAAQQLMEFGLGNVIRIYYSHTNNKEKIKHYYSFSILYYSITSMVFIFVGGVVGFFTFSDYSGDISWETPWVLAILSSALKNMTLPIGAYLDGIQLQEKHQKIKLSSSMLSSIFLWGSLYLGFGLYSISIYTGTSALTFFILTHQISTKKELYDFRYDVIKTVFFDIWDLLKKTIIVWLTGYFFWNGFNLIAFRYAGAEMAGMIGFSIALARSGLDISSQLFLSQTTYISKLISTAQEDVAYKVFKKYVLICSVFLFCGYSSFVLLKIVFPNVTVINRTLSVDALFYLFLYFFLVLLLVLLNNYVRCFKIEPFVWLSTFNGIAIPTSFILCLKWSLSIFMLPSLVMIISLVVSFYIFNITVNNYRKKDESCCG